MNSKVWKLLALLIPPFAIFTGPFFVDTDASVGSISDNLFRDIPIIPAGYATSIWGPIYLGVLALALLQTLPKWTDHPCIVAARMPLLLSMTANFFWIITWLNQAFLLNALVLLTQLATGVWLYLNLRGNPPLPRWLTAPFGMYVAWLMLVTVIITTTLLTQFGFQGFGWSPATWTNLMLVITAALGLFFTLRWSDLFYAAVFPWAFVAIALKPSQPHTVILTAALLATFYLLLIAVRWTHHR